MYYPNLNSILFAVRQVQWRRIVSFVLAMLLFTTAAPFPAFSVENAGEGSGTTSKPNSGELIYDYDTLKITRKGEQIGKLNLLPHEKIELSADGVAEDATYQWQVQHPEKDDVWVNVYDGTKQNISVTLALVENVLRENGTAKLRCRAYTEDYAYLSNPVTVTLRTEQTAQMPAMYAMNKGVLSSNAGVMAADAATPEFVTITIAYIRYDYNKDGNLELVQGEAFPSYVATLTYNALRPNAVPCPDLVGYEASIERVTVGGVDDLDAATLANDEITLRDEKITSDIVVTVSYKPKQVRYQVRYFFQNVYDDLYVEDNSLKAPLLDVSGYTGTTPNLQQQDVTGFTCLYYEPDSIAADGSTVFYVYYERNYYLMEFDCNAGYGTDTVYVRYGTYVSVPDPVRSGYVFAGWDLVSCKDDDGNAVELSGTTAVGTADNLPATLPHYNTIYQALWTEIDTTYSIAYWLQDGEKTAYIGGYLEKAPSGSHVSGGNTLGRTGIGAVCGKLGHIHEGDCFACGELGHIHEIACLPAIISVKSEITDTNSNDYKAMEVAKAAAGVNFDPKEAYIFLIQSDGDINTYHRYWPKVYLNGSYFNIHVNNSDQFGTSNTDTLESITEGGIVASAKDGFTATIYKADVSAGCGTDTHAHVDSCYTCNNTADDHVHDENCVICKTHQHSLECREDAYYLKYEYADLNKLVEGDGSTVVNVYYSYKYYTMRFYFARSKVVDSNVQYSVVGGSTYFFGGNGDYSSYTVQQLLANVKEDQWGKVQALPEINEKYTDRYATGSIEYNSCTYYYLEFTAQFGSDLENIWPVDIFNPVAIHESETHSQCPGLQYAYFSAWNGEHKVKYTQDNASSQGDGFNETIKGLYMYLDEEIIFDQRFQEVAHTDTYGKQTSLVNFLGFWDNGADIYWSVPKEYRYHIMIQTSDAVTTAEEQYDGKNFKQYKEFVVYDNSNLWEINNQTAVALKGYKHIGTTIYNQNTDTDYTASPPNLQDVDYYFYYVPNEHVITFWNHSEYLSDGGGSHIVYGTSLNKYGEYASAMVYSETNLKGKYPGTLEPGAYRFVGWYTSEACLPGTEMDWSQTMPDSDFVVYAKWEPIERDVYFYLTYEEMDLDGDGPDSAVYWKPTGAMIDYPIEVPHGSVLGTAYNHIPERYIDKNGNGQIDADETEKYSFVGWFYIDENGKKRFAPDTMEVKRDLHLFAEWRTEMDTEYKLNYVLKDNDDDPTNNTVIAEPTEGHMSVGHTKTFEAKTGEQLYDAYQAEILFPATSSHSILMEPNPDDNTFTFEYVKESGVWYQVKYVNKVTGTELGSEAPEFSKHAIVTEKYKAFTGYTPESYYITRVLTADGEATAPISENIIVFYYIPTETTALYTVQLYQEKLNSNDPSNTENYELVQTEVFSGTIGNTIKYDVDSDRFAGFSYRFNTVTSYSSGSASVVTNNDNKEAAYLHPSGKLTKDGLEFKIYYSRNTTSYTIQYVEWGTSNVLGYGKLGENGSVYGSADSMQYKVGSTHSFTAPDSVKKNEITYHFFEANDKKQTQSLTMQAESGNNLLTFYYKAKEVTIYYHAVCLTPGAKDQDFGRVSRSHEYLTMSTVEGSTAMPSSGFKFMGWYSDSSCTNKVSDNVTFEPSRPEEDVHYYARFEPILSAMTITKTVKSLPTGMSNDDNFLFRVQGTGKTDYIDIIVSIQGDGSVTLNDLPVGDYIITELTAWSWEYHANTASYTVTVTESNKPTVAFTNTYVEQDWLGGEGSNENVFTNP